MADKLDMKTKSIPQDKIRQLAQLFPSCVKESNVSGDGTSLSIDFDALRQELSDQVVEGAQERYQLTWPDKRKAIALANQQISATLRPDKAKSVDFDKTKNLYIEGDNLDVLKLLRETYLGEIKMIYIDPPYNTGNDFVYEDDFAQTAEYYSANSGQYDEQGKRLVKNLESNGRFHTDWLNMIYPRLKVARDLLANDGVIFISIGDSELSRLIQICDEIFMQRNRLPLYSRITKKSSNSGDNFSPCVDYVLMYAKDIDKIKEFRVDMDAEIVKRYNKEDEYVSSRGPYQEVGLFQSALKHGGSSYPIRCPDGERVMPPNGQPWRWNEQTFMQGLNEGRIVFKKSLNTPLLNSETGERGHWNIYTKVYLKEREESGMHPKNFSDEFQNTLASTELAKLGIPFDFAKPVALIKFFLQLLTDSGDTVLDFFSGSATSAHAVMQLNSEDGGNRNFILVQLPEKCDDKSDAYKAGYKTICEIGEERIRRAGAKIKEDLKNCGQERKLDGYILLRSGYDGASQYAQWKNIETGEIRTESRDVHEPNDYYKYYPNELDVGFRVLKLDSSNMQDVYYNPHAMTQSLLDSTIDNIKLDRTPLDLLFQVMLELGVKLSAKIEEKQVNGKTYYVVNGNDIIACFDDNITNEVIIDIAKQKPLYAVFKDKSFATDSVGINNEQLFKTYSPATVIKII